MSKTSATANNVLSTAVRLLCLTAVIIMLYISVHVYGASLSGLAILAAFALVYVQLPGLLLLKAASLRPKYMSTTLALGFFSGWIIELCVYFLADWLRSEVLLYAAGPALAILYLISSIIDGRRGLQKRIRINRIPVLFCIFLVLILFYCIINTQYIYLSPTISELTYMNPDKAYHMGLINSLSHDYPLESPWIKGVFINYHIFSEILMSIPVRLFDLSADLLTLSFGPFLTAYCFGISLYSFFREMSAKPNRAGIYCMIVLLSNLYVTRNTTSSLAFKFILINDNSAGYGMAAALMTIVLFRMWYDAITSKASNRYRLLVLLTLFVMLTAGIKGPMGAVAVAGIWGTMVLGMIMRKVSPKTLPALMTITAGFVLIYVTVLGSKGQSNASGNSVIEFATITDIAFWKKPLIELLKSYSLPTSVRLGIVLLVFAMFFLSAFFIPFCIGYLRELILVLSGRKTFEPAKVLVYAEFVIGFVAMFVLNYSGHSQVYFGLVSAFLAPMIAFWLIEDLEEKAPSSRLSRYSLRVIVFLSALILVVSSYSLLKYYDIHIKEAARNANPAIAYNEYESISREEYEAMQWIEHNTEDDALLATDRYYSVSPDEYSYKDRWANRFFLYAVYSNRFSYISGSGYNLPKDDWPVRQEMIETNNLLYDETYEDRGDLARELDIDYVVVSKRFTEVGDLSNDDYELCYSNDDVDIYKVDANQ